MNTAPAARAMIAGWFSFPGCNATAGDILAAQVLAGWISEAGLACDIARAEPFEPLLDWKAVDPQQYTHLFFVCGPFRDRPMSHELLERFDHCQKVGVNLSMIERLADFNPFDLLYERDSERTTRPDLVFASDPARVPVAALLLVHKQKEYGDRGLHKQTHQLIHQTLAGRNIACVPVDTVLENNATGLHTIQQINTVIARADLVITTRMHGLVMALHNGVPAVAIDAIQGGAKVLAQARSVQWPIVTTADDLTADWINQSIDRCLKAEIRQQVALSQIRAREALESLRQEMIDAITRPSVGISQ
ncbi:polysaccharide pyruvyl transferase family protein [Planctomycetales bacterium ZRK34]|nr:polysaccharide pyruvyl transferase family protein [Planctomycetales bacterium ZRK34]